MIDIVERRRFKRYPVYCPMQYKREGAMPSDSSMSVNMCEGGALLTMPRAVETGENLIVRLFMKGKEFFVRSKVVHVQRLQERDPYSVGVEFMEKAPEFLMRFYEELEGIMFFQKRYSEELGKEVSLTEASMKWYRSSPIWSR
ncbi:MAG: PilZ domain-containing protein [Candidatus Omnitrophota bacterium]